MQLTAGEKAIISEAIVAYDALKKRGAFQIITDIREIYGEYAKRLGIYELESEDDLRNWLGFHDRNEYSVKEVLELDINPHLLLWSVISEEVLPSSIIHHLSMGYAEDFLARLGEKSVYIDYRFKNLLQVKKRWINNEASLGELYAAQRKSLEIYKDSYESNDSGIISSALAVYSIMLDNSVSSVRGVFSAAEQVFDIKRETIRRFQLFKNALKEA